MGNSLFAKRAIKWRDQFGNEEQYFEDWMQEEMSHGVKWEAVFEPYTKDDVVPASVAQGLSDEQILEAAHFATDMMSIIGGNNYILRIARAVLSAAQSQQEFVKHEPDADGFSEWVCPTPSSYLMKCCDCGLVHEAQFRVVIYEPKPSEDFTVCNNEDMQAQFRMRRAQETK